jgi:hypothetical protein
MRLPRVFTPRPRARDAAPPRRANEPLRGAEISALALRRKIQ